ncbi:MAG: molybdopterin-binding protein [Silicimonas sp.]|nr:molybdopterin-binding protein [Silicimonas sp.]
MKFGPVPLDQAEGAILAHSQSLAGGALKKGTLLDPAHIVRLRAAGVTEITVARLEPGDLTEDAAARSIGARLLGPDLRLAEAFTGRSNIVAETAGVLQVNAAAIAATNDVDEGITLATLPDLMRVAPGQLLATIKIIPYGVSARAVDGAIAALGNGALALRPFQGGRAQLVMTRTPGFKDSLLTKGRQVVETRCQALNYALGDVQVTDHKEENVARALDAEADLILILGASATSDRADVAPAAVTRAGGRIERFGMPVDPGNLIFLGTLGRARVVGLPGCARSPALNGVDWVLERLSARIPVDSDAIAAMGVGGLLKEMPGRPEPRQRQGR